MTRVASSAQISNEGIETARRESSEGDVSGRVLEDVAGCLADKFGPVLKVMRIFGMYCGETNFNRLPSCQGPRLYGTLYCGVAVLLMWVMFFTTTVTFFYHDISKIVVLAHLLQNSLWLLICAGSATVCLFVLPVGRKNTSRFEKFLCNIISSHQNVKFSAKNTKKMVIGTSVVVVSNVVCMASIITFYENPLIVGKPWNGFPVYKKLVPLLVVLSIGAWLYPVILLCSVCSVLVETFDDLEQRVTLAVKEGTFDIDQFRHEHSKLCQTVEHADKACAPLFLAKLGGHVPLLTILCYKLAKFPSLTSETFTLFIGTIMWSAAGIAIVSTLLIHASRVNDKIHAFGNILHQSCFSARDAKESCELLIFLNHLQAEPLGLTLGGFVVITKSFSLTVLGALVSYFTVLLSLPQ